MQNIFAVCVLIVVFIVVNSFNQVNALLLLPYPPQVPCLGLVL